MPNVYLIAMPMASPHACPMIKKRFNDQQALVPRAGSKATVLGGGGCFTPVVHPAVLRVWEGLPQ